MSKHSLPSIEQFAAYLDGNLPQSEMQQFSQLAEHDNTLHQLLDASSLVDSTLAGFSDSDLQLPPEIVGSDFELPGIDDFENFSFVDDSFAGNDSLYQQEGMNADENYQQDSETLNSSETMATSYRTYGESGENIYDPIYIKQPDDHSCGLRSQQIVLRDFGIDIPFEDLERYALDAGVYSENGTYTYDIGKVLEMAGVGMHQVKGSTMYDLTSELAQGHRVIVSVDADELWHNNTFKGKVTNWLSDVFGHQGGNHALIVAGIEVNPSNPNDIQVVLTDPGAGHLRVEYPLKQFMDAWKDSNCFMAATDCPAPYQYDVETGMEVPSNFYVEHNYNNQFVVDNGYQLNPDKINIPTGYQPAFAGHIDMVGDLAYEDYVSLHPAVNPTEELFNNTLKETTGSVGADLISPIEDGNQDDSHSISTDILRETTGSVGSELLTPIGDNEGRLENVGETTGGIGADLIGSDGVAAFKSDAHIHTYSHLDTGEVSADGYDMSHVGETAGDVSTHLLGDSEGSGSVGIEIQSEGDYLLDDFMDSTLNDNI